MKKLLGTLVALATLGFAAPAFACGGSACNCDKKAKKAACDHGEKADKDDSAKGCGQHKAKNQADDSTAKATAEAKLDIEGMSCGGCANHLASTLEDVDGVVEADVSFEDGNATVKYDADQLDAESLVETVQNAHDGKFSAELVSQSSVKS